MKKIIIPIMLFIILIMGSAYAYDITDFSFYDVAEDGAISWTQPSDTILSPDGNYLFQVDGNNQNIRRQTITTAYNISATTSGSVTQYVLNPATLDLWGIKWGDDGNYVYVMNPPTDTILQFALTTPYVLAGVNSDAVGSFATTSQETAPYGFDFADNGNILYVGGSLLDAIVRYNLTSPYNISTAVYDSVSSDIGFNIGGFAFISDTQFLEVSNQANTLYLYNITDNDVSTIVLDSSMAIGYSATWNGVSSLLHDGFLDIYLTGYNNDYIVQFRATEESDEPIISIINTSQSSDINTQAISEITFNATISVTGNESPLTNGSANIIHYINTSLNNGCAVFEDRVCTEPSSYRDNDSMTKISETFYEIDLDDTHLFPAYYPFDAQIMEGAVKTQKSLYLNNYLLWEIINMTTDMSADLFLALEGGLTNLTTNNPLTIFYCNETYTQSGNPTHSDNCELITSVLPEGLPTHYHGTLRHYVFGIHPTITRTPVSSFVFVSTATSSAKGWTIGYFTNASYNSDEFMTGNYNSFVRNSNIYDVHLHQLLETDAFNYYVEYQSDESSNSSALVTDTYDIANRPPDTPIIYSPCDVTYAFDSATSNDIYFNWSAVTDADNDSFNYTIRIRMKNTILGKDVITLDNGTNLYNWTTDVTNLYHGEYVTTIKTCDTENLCSNTQSECTFDICIPDFVTTPQPCIGGVSALVYYDNNTCGLYNDLPSDNGTYQTCTLVESREFNVQGWTYALFILFIVLLGLIGIVVPILWLIDGFVLGFFAFMLLFDLGSVPLFAVTLLAMLSLGIAGLIRALDNDE